MLPAALRACQRGRLMSWEDDHRRIWESINATDRIVASHKDVCEERHKEIQRRFEHADEGRATLRAELKEGMGELRSMLSAAHKENQAAITTIERGNGQRWLNIASAVLVAILAAALGYVVRK